MKKFGLEKEYFLKKGDVFVIIPDKYPKDECGWLLELRTEPYGTVDEAIDDLLLQELKFKRKLESDGYSLVEIPVAELTQEVVRQALSEHTKGIPEYLNYLGFEYHKNKASEKLASVHISITDQEVIDIPQNSYDLYVKSDGKIEVRENKGEPIERTINKSFDFMKYFIKLDREFKEEISNASRVPGMYEFKPDGRVEYRSLPNTIDLFKLAKVIKSCK